METDIDPLHWGWKMINNKMVPIMTDEVSFLDESLVLSLIKLRNIHVTSCSQALVLFQIMHNSGNKFHVVTFTTYLLTN